MERFAVSSSALSAAANDIIEAAGNSSSIERVKIVLCEIIDRFHALGTLVHEEEDDELLLYSGRNLTIYHITLSPGLQYPPHNHLMDALIGIYRGNEINFIYPFDGRKLGPPERQDVAAPGLMHMPPDTVHSVANAGNARSGALHVYFGDLAQADRQLWGLQDERGERFDNDRYMAGARPLDAGYLV